ncbi:PEP-CTERM sorting domain-containing protein [Rugamonas sp. CCM 8940]|uniref:PEP-CTERM sorting domain-containing protein n=1 Tax=Rugamonas sp. CCM 8940 TaxID=2765359 RepID=UPI001F2AB18D|nr:PEP-CTERM sorting domain-containing protein [Rugamonas sp. CCM 8940]
MSAISLAAVLCAGSVQAAPTSAKASIGISNFHYTLIDLDTSDNIAPSIHFNFPDSSDPQGSSVGANATVHPNGEKEIDQWAGERNVKVVDVSRSASVMGMVNSSGTVVAGGGESGLQGATLAVQGTAEIPTDSAFRGSADYSSQGRIFGAADFTLSPHTKLVFSFDLAVSASVFANKNQTARNETTFNANLLYFDALGKIHYSAIIGRRFNLDAQWNSAESVNEAFALSMSNTTADDLAGRVGMASWMSGEVSAVPEPETYAMLLAGLGLLGFMAKRRRA